MMTNHDAVTEDLNPRIKEEYSDRLIVVFYISAILLFVSIVAFTWLLGFFMGNQYSVMH